MQIKSLPNGKTKAKKERKIALVVYIVLSGFGRVSVSNLNVTIELAPILWAAIKSAAYFILQYPTSIFGWMVSFEDMNVCHCNKCMNLSYHKCVAQ